MLKNFLIVSTVLLILLLPQESIATSRVPSNCRELLRAQSTLIQNEVSQLLEFHKKHHSNVRVAFEFELFPHLFKRLLPFIAFESSWNRLDSEQRAVAWERVMLSDPEYRALYSDPQMYEHWETKLADYDIEPLTLKKWLELKPSERAARGSVEWFDDFTRSHLLIGRMPWRFLKSAPWVFNRYSAEPDIRVMEFRLKQTEQHLLRSILLGVLFQEAAGIEVFHPKTPYQKNVLGATYHIHYSLNDPNVRIGMADFYDRLSKINHLIALEILHRNPGSAEVLDNELNAGCYSCSLLNRGIINLVNNRTMHFEVRNHYEGALAEIEQIAHWLTISKGAFDEETTHRAKKLLKNDQTLMVRIQKATARAEFIERIQRFGWVR